MLDTNSCIYITKSHLLEVLARLETLLDGDTVMFVVTYARLCTGLEIQASHRAEPTTSGCWPL